MTPSKIKKMFGISYLGGCNSPKLEQSKDLNVLTYGLYLAPHNLSGYNVCPESQECKKYCLHSSGRNKLELLKNQEGGKIQESRIKKTKMFFENTPRFMHLLCYEIEAAREKARQLGMQFAVRLNCTSDISPEKFTLEGKNILQLYPDIQFYDYTKVYSRIPLTEKYPNYDLTFSYSGTNWAQCKKLLSKGHRIAVVFEKEIPDTFQGYPVINANKHDARYLDKGGIICGLTYKKVASDYSTGKFQTPRTPFVITSHSQPYMWRGA